MSRAFSSRVLLDNNGAYLKDTSIPLVEQANCLSGMTAGGIGEGSRGFNSSSRSMTPRN